MSGGRQHYGRYRPRPSYQQPTQRPGGVGSVHVSGLTYLRAQLLRLRADAPDPGQMDDQELLTWAIGLRNQLEDKRCRELAYLERRAQRGAHTPTDTAYENDQILEEQLLALLDMMIEAGDAAQQEDEA